MKPLSHSQQMMSVVGLLLALWLFSPSPLVAQFGGFSVQSTKPKPIGPTGRSAEGPRPKAPNVCVQHTLLVDANTGKAYLKAKFVNKDNQAKRFVFCQMVGINKNEEEVQAVCDIEYDMATMKVKCVMSARKFDSHVDAYHFGCKEVSLMGKETKVVDYGMGQHDKFKGKKASDFYVTYADYVELPMGATFEAATCANCFGKDATTGVGSSAILGDWYLPKLPFDDPYLLCWPIDSAFTPYPKEYRSFLLPLGLPSLLSITVPQLPHNVPDTVPPSYIVPLNLFDIYTMSADTTDSFRVAITLLVEGTQDALEAFQVDPIPGVPFTIPGGREPFGEITIFRPIPPLQEGDTAEIEVQIHHPDTDSMGQALFSQKGSFIHDTWPPVVLGYDVQYGLNDSVSVQVTAFDSTTSPLAANFWYSLLGDSAWEVINLDPASSLFESDPVRDFSGAVGNIAPTQTIEYFFMIQDEVFNWLYYGVGTLSPTDAIDYLGGIPSRLELGQNYPNPFSDHSYIPFSLPKSTRVQVQILDLKGNLVLSLLDAYQVAGNYRIELKREALAAGIYVYQLITEDGSLTQKLIIE